MDDSSNKNGFSSDESVEFIEELCVEFSQILYDISKENDRMYCSLLARNKELEALCEKYEKTQGSISGAIKIRLRQIKDTFQKAIKSTLKGIAKNLFAMGKRLATQFGIKDRIKRTKLYRTLCLRGIIDKLRK